jgi:hypothetical protein
MGVVTASVYGSDCDDDESLWGGWRLMGLVSVGSTQRDRAIEKRMSTHAKVWTTGQNRKHDRSRASSRRRHNENRGAPETILPPSRGTDT